MTRPSKYPRWASKIVKNSINDEYNVYEPPERKKDIGWDLNEVPPRQWLNWLFRTINDWIEYLGRSVNRPEGYLKKNLPDPTKCKALTVFIEDIDGGVLAYSDGEKWKIIKVKGNI